MDKINISNLTGNAQDNGVLDINTLAKQNQPKSSIEKEVEDIITIKNNRRIEKLNQYSNHVRICLKKINEMNLAKQTELVYTFPKYCFQCPDYDIEECINYVSTRLRKLGFLVCTYEDDSIFIGWKYIEFTKIK